MFRVSIDHVNSRTGAVQRWAVVDIGYEGDPNDRSMVRDYDVKTFRMEPGASRPSVWHAGKLKRYDWQTGNIIKLVALALQAALIGTIDP